MQDDSQHGNARFMSQFDQACEKFVAKQV